MGFFSQKMRSLFSSKNTSTDEEWSDDDEVNFLPSTPSQEPDLDESMKEEPVEGRFSPRTSPELTATFKSSEPAQGKQREEGKEAPLILSPSRDVSSESYQGSTPDRILPSDELSYDPDESIEVPIDLMESYSASPYRRASRQILSPHQHIEEWQEDHGDYDDEQAPPQTVFSLPIEPNAIPYEEEATIAPPPSVNFVYEPRARRRKASVQPEHVKTHVFGFQDTDEGEVNRRIRLEKVLSPVHIPSLQEMSVMMKHWLIDRIKQQREEEMSDEEADELHRVWNGYFELRPDDYQAKLEYGWFMLDFYGKNAAHDYFQTQYETSEASDQFLYALTSLSYRTGDSLGACEYMKVLFEHLPEDLQVLELKLEIERSLKKNQEAEETERLMYRQRGLQESVGGY